MARSYAKAKGRSEGKRFFAIPHYVSGCANFIALSGVAQKLLIDLGRQYFGSNNGDLCAAFSVLRRERGWKSKETLNDALAELQHYGMIVLTQYGGLNRKPNLYALTWLKVDKAQKNTEIVVGSVPGNWRTPQEAKFVRPSTKSRAKSQKS